MNSEYRESYNAGQELIPDFAYDALRNNDTSLSYDADDIIGKGALVPHAYPMLSLPTHYLNVDEITLEQIDALCGSHDTYIVSFKYDGVSISAPVNGLGYTGRLVSRGKRHSGFVLHPMFMQQMPKFLDRPDGLPITDSMNAEVRGEFVISKADFETINKTLTIAYANERSMVSAQLSANEPNPDI
jgi:NAD-dependent DNA ligase